MIIGNVIRDSVKPPTNAEDRGIPNKLIKIASPSKPKRIEGMAARLLMFTSII